jgi:hypothetical protein
VEALSRTALTVRRRLPGGRKKPKWGMALAAFGLLGLFMLFGSVLFVSLLFTLFMEKPAPEGNQQWEAAQGFPQAARKYLPIYLDAGRKYGVPWPILAAIHKVETDFGRNLSVSPVGARGHTQFMDKTWLGWSYPGGTKLGDLPDTVDLTDPKLIAKYGGYGVDANGDGKADPYDPVDAIHATAKYLAANHRPGEDWFARRGAVWQYNHDYEGYVLKVKAYAAAFARPVLAGNVQGSGRFLWPVPGGKLTSEFGFRPHPITGVLRQHEGVDIARELGAPILASDAGVVVESRAAQGYGWMIVIDHGNGYQTLYAHMQPGDVLVRVGQKVAKGELIARVGQNGWATGPHLHFEVRQNGQLIDPMLVLGTGGLATKKGEPKWKANP